MTQQGIIVEHLLEVRNKPAGVDRIAMKAASYLIVYTTAGHSLQGVFHYQQGILVATPVVIP